MKTLSYIKYIVAAALLSLASCTNEEIRIFYPDQDGTGDEDLIYMPLKEKASFNIGTATKLSHIAEAEYDSTLVEHFDQITAEYEMKMNVIWTAEGEYDWTSADAIVDYAQSNNLDVHGHVLVWYNAFPTWLVNANYDSTTLEAHIEDYITEVVTRYKGKVRSWDVFNEVFEDDGSFRENELIASTFEDPIAFYGRCLEYTRAADADATLFYNDYSVVIIDVKRNAILDMVDRLLAEGYPLDGIGDQFHYKVNTSVQTMQEGLTDIASTGLLIHISELDIVMNVYQDGDYSFSGAEQLLQEEIFEEIVSMYVALPVEQQYGITTWGVTDKYTWLTSFWHPKEYPLLFDEYYNTKRAFDGFLSALE